MKRIVGGVVAVLSLAIAGSALAHPPSTVSITSVIDVTPFPSAPPFKATYVGTFTTSVGDHGGETVQALFGAVPSHSVGVFQSLRTLTSDDRVSTLVLRCRQIAKAKDISTDQSVPDTGSCVVLTGTGAYASLSGSGSLSGSAVFNDTGTGAILTDTVSLG